MIIKLAQDYHDIITELYDEYRELDQGFKPSVKERNSASNALIEEYIETHKERPPNALLSRLASYVLLDDLSDSHPDKMSREEYPIMSYGQTGRRYRRHRTMDDVQYGDMRHLGRRKVNSSMVTDDGEDLDESRPYVSSIHLIGQDRMEVDDVVDRLSFADIIESSNLTERQREVVELIFLDDLTQVKAGEVLGVNRHTINEHLAISLRKMKAYLRDLPNK